ncbi:DUF542 domain-containing protein [Neorhodopirellula pilleata]|uniref:Iron-sulfur cluster repair protein ScdA n=1 Tax=Neorhodopirellula pilleata TaxID=2714738 RepID=A0A5C6AB41_9BACT|nr:DUF542 domain-containing protein [Neorhodopirellula pilleata]TWT97234.1 Iron-sulfur cluster repair protein ScdA [Neorhodopirellula pilleata]
MSDSRIASLPPSATVGDWVANYPETAEVFDMLQIDYCCDGTKPLENACWENGLEVIRVHSLLKHTVAQAGNKHETDWMHASLTKLCDEIEHTHHKLLKETLPLLSDMMAEVVSLHGESHESLHEVQQHFMNWRDDILGVMAEEERSLFPAIRELEAGGKPDACLRASLNKMIHRIQFNHEDIGKALKNARTASENFKAPCDACPKFAQMYGLLRWIENDVRHHVHKEESILFPRVRQSLNHAIGVNPGE